MKTDSTKKRTTAKIPRTSQPGKAASRQDKPAVEEVAIETSAIDPFDVADDAPISLAPRPKKLAWNYSILREIDAKTMDDLVVEAGTKVAIEGSLDKLGYLYVVQIGDDRSIEILFPPAGGPRRARPGVPIRLPSGSGWIVTTKKGKLRTITSVQPLSDAEIAALL